MRNLKRVSLVSLVSVALLSTMALPASAADTDPTTVTVTVEGAPLNITAPTTPITFTAAAPTVAGGAVIASVATTTIEGVTVTDLNADGTAWQSTVTLGTLTSGLKTIPSSAVSFTTSALAKSDGVEVVSNGGNQQATGVSNNTASWNTTINVTIPADVVVGEYTAILTHSVS